MFSFIILVLYTSFYLFALRSTSNSKNSGMYTWHDFIGRFLLLAGTFVHFSHNSTTSSRPVSAVVIIFFHKKRESDIVVPRSTLLNDAIS